MIVLEVDVDIGITIQGVGSSGGAGGRADMLERRDRAITWTGWDILGAGDFPTVELLSVSIELTPDLSFAYLVDHQGFERIGNLDRCQHFCVGTGHFQTC